MNANINLSEIWVVDLCQFDDYRFKDAEFFETLDDANAYIEWIKENDGNMVSVGRPFPIRSNQILTLEDAKKRYNSLYGLEEEE